MRETCVACYNFAKGTPMCLYVTERSWSMVRGTRGESGLGLLVCSEIVRAHRGTMSVTSDAVRGTLFTVTLPLGAAQGPAPVTVDESAEQLAG